MEQDGLIVRPDASQTSELRQARACRQGIEKDLDTAHEVEIVKELLDGSLIGQAVEELQRPQSSLDHVRNHDFLRDASRHLHLGHSDVLHWYPAW